MRVRVYARVGVRVCVRTCVRVGVRVGVCVRVRIRVRMGACAYMRGYGTVSGGGMRLSDVGSCLVIVAWCNCCMCNYMGMGVVALALWFVVFCRVAVVSTRRGMLVFPMVLIFPDYPA